MKTQIFTALIAVLFGAWCVPSATFAHHLGQGMGSAPDLVDNYAHGANAGGGIDSGFGTDLGSGQGPDIDINMGDGTGMAQTGADSNGYGEPTDDGVNGPSTNIPGGAEEPGGPNDDTGVDTTIFETLLR